MSARTSSVIVVTYERTAVIGRCLDQLAAQTAPPTEVVVVDSSESDDTARLVQERYPAVRYEASGAGRGAVATARDIGFRLSSGEIVVYIDDDAFAEPTWLERLLVHFDDPTVGGVGGRQIRGQPGELTEGIDAIGRLLPDGTLTGNFTADPGRVIEVDHLLGASMSFRRSIIDGLGGVRDGYEGTCIREETDLCLRVAATGARLLYEPNAVVEHVAATYHKGSRFDLRYAYWAQKNHLILLMRNFGASDPIVRHYLGATARHSAEDTRHRGGRALERVRAKDLRGAAKSVGGALSRVAVVAGGSLTGAVAGASAARSDRRAG